MDSCGPAGRESGFEKENKTVFSLHDLKDKMGHPSKMVP